MLFRSRPTLPAWRRAASRAELVLRVAGDAPADTQSLVAGVVPVDHPTLLLIDDAQVVAAAGAGDALAGVWSNHPAVVALARTALRDAV